VLTFGGGGIGNTPDFWGNDYFDDTLKHNGKLEAFRGYCTDVFFRSALEFIERNRDRPFFAYIPTNAPHSPFNVPDSYSRPYLERGVPEARAKFYGMIANIDENVGRLMARLDALGLADNTLLVFMTDNGSSTGWDEKSGGFNAHMRGFKGSEYDGGHRVPCFLRWPGHLEAGKDVASITAHVDLLPTLIDLCNLRRPETVAFDGTSLRPLLEGARDWPARTLFVHSQRIDQPEKWRRCAVMTDRWRLVNGTELYEIVDDPGQAKDVAAQHSDVVATLRRAYEAWWSSISQRFDEYCPIVVGTGHENPTPLCCHDWHGTVAPSLQEYVRKEVNANGFWALDVARAGRYEITLRQQPAVAEFAIPAKTARLIVAGIDLAKSVPPGATQVTFAVRLAAGPTRLKSWLTSADGTSHGAYFVDVTFLE
jgi:hypothetical protein